MTLTKPILAAVTVLSLGAPAMADPTLGLGLTFTFGGGAPQAGVGLRVFSDNGSDSFVASAGVDYLFGSGAFRGTVGGAYLGSDAYIGLDAGLNFNGGGFGFGIGAGGTNTEEPRRRPPV